jgi:hypothetical protein
VLRRLKKLRIHTDGKRKRTLSRKRRKKRNEKRKQKLKQVTQVGQVAQVEQVGVNSKKRKRGKIPRKHA